MAKITILVIHVKGNKEREAYIQKQLEKLDMPYHFILDGNIEDLTPEILDKYFSGDMYGQYPRTSCAYKHLLAMQYMIEHRLESALIVEDDLRFYHNFKDFFEKSVEECSSKYADMPFIANFEESSLLFVPRSQRRKGIVLYPAQRDRYAGCYYINRLAAQAILEYVTSKHSDTTSDLLHTRLLNEGKLHYFWSHPCLACQCSCDGSMPTMIPTRPRPLKRLKWFYKHFYKRLLYFLR